MSDLYNLQMLLSKEVSYSSKSQQQSCYTMPSFLDKQFNMYMLKLTFTKTNNCFKNIFIVRLCYLINVNKLNLTVKCNPFMQWCKSVELNYFCVSQDKPGN